MHSSLEGRRDWNVRAGPTPTGAGAAALAQALGVLSCSLYSNGFLISGLQPTGRNTLHIAPLYKYHTHTHTLKLTLVKQHTFAVWDAPFFYSIGLSEKSNDRNAARLLTPYPLGKQLVLDDHVTDTLGKAGEAPASSGLAASREGPDDGARHIG